MRNIPKLGAFLLDLHSQFTSGREDESDGAITRRQEGLPVMPNE